jgi:hypothetical protein
MNEYSKLILVGTVLLFFGVPLVTTSSYKIFFEKDVTITSSGVLMIKANSTADFGFWALFGDFPKSDQILVVVSESPDLQNLLNSTLNYHSTMNPEHNITISIVGNHIISASERVTSSVTYEYGLAAAHWFNIPSDWWAGCWVRVSNPENYPVCWVVSVVLYGPRTDAAWCSALVLGIGTIIIGLVVFRIANVRRNKLKRAVESGKKPLEEDHQIDT